MAGFRVHVAVSLDGFIADRDGSTDWLAAYPAIQDETEAFLARIGTLVMGRFAYDHCRAKGAWPYGDRRCLVVTSRGMETAPDPVEPWLGDIAMLVDDLRAAPGGDVWVAGGGKAIRAFLDLGAIDHLDLFVVPLLLGTGRPLFTPSDIATRLTLLSSKATADGLVRLRYRA
jgi:dihydrofolate reductase